MKDANEIHDVRAPWWFFPVAIAAVFGALYLAAKTLELLEIRPGKI